MIEKNTVIITGAGANKDYGFPTGQDLKNDIPDKLIEWYKTLILPPIGPYGNTWNDFDETDNNIFFRQYNKFISAFQDADIPIDQYISQQNLSTGFEKIAKHAIILGIIEYEFQSKLQGNWLEELFSQMTHTLHKNEGYNNFDKNNITFITFNYDRAIEHFLFKRVRDSYSISEKKTKEALIGIKTIHVYGSIGNLLWEPSPELNFGGEGSRPLGALTSLLSDNIDLIRETRNVNELKSYQKIRTVLEEAERLYILGFGYYDYNLKVLGFPNSITNVEQVYSTNKGLIGRRFDRTKANIFKNQSSKDIFIEDISCKELLQKYDLE